MTTSSPEPGHPRARRSVNGLALQLCAVALSFILVALLVVTSSHAAFVAGTDNTPNEVTAASIELRDDDAGAAMFADVTGLVPGVVLERCIEVTYTGADDPSPVVLYGTGTSGALADHLDLQIDVGPDTDDPFGDCTDFVPDAALFTGTVSGFAALYGSYAGGMPTWEPVSSPETRVFRFQVQVEDTQAAEGLSATFGYTWEVRTP